MGPSAFCCGNGGVMKISTKFGYAAEVETATGNKVDRRYVEEIELEIGSIPSSQAPVALRRPGFHAKDAYLRDNQPLEVLDIRLFDGALYEPVYFHAYQHGRMGPWPFLETDDEPALLLRSAWNVAPLAAAENVNLKGPPKPRTVISSGRDRALQELKDYSASFLVIDGHVHRRLGEPVYVAHPGSVGCVLRERMESKVGVFRLTEREEAIALAAALKTILPSEVSVQEMEILDLSWVDTGPAEWHETAFFHAVVEVENSLSDHLTQHPMDVVMAYADLRDARTRCFNYKGNRDFVSVGIALDEALDLMEAKGMGCEATIVARSAVRMWRQRNELSLDDEMALAF